MYRKLKRDIEKSRKIVDEVLLGKPELDKQIEAYDEKVKKLNNEVDNFYGRMHDHHKLNLEKERQNKMQEICANHRQEVESKYGIQEQILKGMIDQYEKDKAESEAKNKEVIIYKGCNIIIRKGDLTQEREDAIVNPANEQLDHAGGAAYAIASKGGKVIDKESRKYIKKYGSLPTGEATTTNAGNLLCEKVIHVVGPIYPKNCMRDQKQREELRSAIKSILGEMNKYNFKSVSFPAISTGIFRFPLELCAMIIGDVLKEAIDNDPDFYKDRRLIICNFDDKTTNKMLEYIPNCFTKTEIITDTEGTFISK